MLNIKSKIILLVTILVLASSLIVGFYVFNITKEQLQRPIGEDGIGRLQRETFAIIFTTFAVALIITFIFAHTLIRPFDDLIIGTQLVANGRLDYRIRKRGSDEVGKLVDSFNDMIEKLSVSNQQKTRFSSIARVEKSKADLIIDSMADGVIVTDAQNKIVLINPAAQSLFYVSGRKFIGKNIMYFFHKFGLQALGRDFPDIGEGFFPRNRPQIKVREIELKEPRKKVIKATIGPLIEERRRIAGTVIVFEDITKSKEIEDMKTEFLSTVSHELRTPLTSIKGFSTLLLDEKLGALNEQQKRSLSVISKETERLTTLINDILDLSKMELGKAKMKWEDVSLEECFRACPALILARKKEQRLSIEVQKKLPLVQADRAKIAQVFTNLISNAVKFTPPGGRITVRMQARQDFVEVSISDTGVGIAKKNLSRLFSKFYQVESSLTRSQPGTGLGLAIVKEIIGLHHGLICVKSIPGKGTTIAFALPRRQPSDAELDKCWEVKGCRNMKCPAYQSKDNRCWLVMGTYCNNKQEFDKIELCRQCRVYRKRIDNGKNTIG